MLYCVCAGTVPSADLWLKFYTLHPRRGQTVSVKGFCIFCNESFILVIKCCEFLIDFISITRHFQDLCLQLVNENSLAYVQGL